MANGTNLFKRLPKRTHFVIFLAVLHEIDMEVIKRLWYHRQYVSIIYSALSTKSTMHLNHVFIAPYKIAVTGFKKHDLVWTDKNNGTARGNLSVTGFLLYQTVGPSWQRTPQHMCVYSLSCDMSIEMVAKILWGGKSIRCELMMHDAKSTMHCDVHLIVRWSLQWNGHWILWA